MKKAYIITSIILLVSSMTNAFSQQHMRFHCENDTIKINQLLKKGYDSKLTNSNELMVFYGNELIGTQYAAQTLEGENELLTINIDQLDCTTFVETLYALARTTLNGRYSWRDFANSLESVRYRNGQMNGYASRLHYFSDWVVDNSHRGNIVEVTSLLPDVRYEIRTLDYMSMHRDEYPALSDSATYAQLKSFEIAYRMHRFPYIRKDAVESKKIKEKLKVGDIVAFVTKTDGLDVSHMGVIVTDEKGMLHLLHASLKGGMVMIEKDDLKEMLRRNRNCTGVRIIRIKDTY